MIQDLSALLRFGMAAIKDAIVSKGELLLYKVSPLTGEQVSHFTCAICVVPINDAPDCAHGSIHLSQCECHHMVYRVRL